MVAFQRDKWLGFSREPHATIARKYGASGLERADNRGGG